MGEFQVTWVEHMEYDESNVHQVFQPLLRSGMGFGAQRWVATLERQCECLAVLMSSTIPSGDHAGLVPPVLLYSSSLIMFMQPYFHSSSASCVIDWHI
jgi:hypothetical protein